MINEDDLIKFFGVRQEDKTEIKSKETDRDLLIFAINGLISAYKSLMISENEKATEYSAKITESLSHINK